MTSSGTIRSIDMRLIDDLFDMGGGYVLDFSNHTFAEFFLEELGVDIDDPQFNAEGTSKAKRLRFFLKISKPTVRIQTLQALWKYRETIRRRNRREETIPDAEKEFHSLIEHLGGRRPTSNRQHSTSQTTSGIAPSLSDELKGKLMDLQKLEPQPRGYAFERFLKDLFDANGLVARAAFKLVGEQIDGSFELSGEVYLLEAKWQDPKVGARDLRSFNGQIEDKAAWSRGLFVSYSGFTEDGLEAFGRGKRVVCMEGLDLYEMLDRNLSFSDVMARKVRHAAESGNPFVRLRDLYP